MPELLCKKCGGVALRKVRVNGSWVGYCGKHEQIAYRIQAATHQLSIIRREYVYDEMNEALARENNDRTVPGRLRAHW